MQYAAAGDTWGIPGPTFLLFFLATAVAVAIAAAVHRRVLFAGERGARVDELGPQQVAFLNGGDQLAVYAALGGLRAAGSIGSAPDKTLRQSGPLPAGVTPLDTAVYNAAGRRIRARDVRTDQWVVAALHQLRAGLERAGLAVPAASVRTARLWALAGAAVVALGIARLVAGVRNDKPVGFLIPAIILAIVLTIAMITKSTVRTRAATKGMSSVRQSYQHLSPGQSPSYATYGAAGAAMGVALYGAASLYTMDPAFAAEAEIQRISASGGTSGSSSSCGSGSSSCGGGGGGCGGGGCGG